MDSEIYSFCETCYSRNECLLSKRDVLRKCGNSRPNGEVGQRVPFIKACWGVDGIPKYEASNKHQARLIVNIVIGKGIVLHRTTLKQELHRCVVFLFSSCLA